MSSLKLQLPNNYVEIEGNEMEYIDGGVTAHRIKKSYDKRVISYPVNAIGWYFTGGAISAGLLKLSTKVSSAIGGVLGAKGIANVAAGFTGRWWNFGGSFSKLFR